MKENIPYMNDIIIWGIERPDEKKTSGLTLVMHKRLGPKYVMCMSGT